MGDGFQSKLTPLGRKQARLTARRLTQWPIDALYTSDIIRAVETAEIITLPLDDLHVRRTPILREVVVAAIPGYRVPLRQRREGRERLRLAYERFFRPSRSTRHEVFIGHGGMIRSLVCITQQKPLTHGRTLWPSNCGITRFAVWPGGQVRLLSYNDTGHLPAALIDERHGP